MKNSTVKKRSGECGKTIKIPISSTLEEAIKLFSEAVQAIKKPDPELF